MSIGPYERMWLHLVAHLALVVGALILLLWWLGRLSGTFA
jgi:hypothetical protein